MDINILRPQVRRDLSKYAWKVRQYTWELLCGPPPHSDRAVYCDDRLLSSSRTLVGLQGDSGSDLYSRGTVIKLSAVTTFHSSFKWMFNSSLPTSFTFAITRLPLSLRWSTCIGENQSAWCVPIQDSLSFQNAPLLLILYQNCGM